ncbi:MAG TPA: DUF3794 domain-containing protein [Bacillota bacterium]
MEKFSEFPVFPAKCVEEVPFSTSRRFETQFGQKLHFCEVPVSPKQHFKLTTERVKVLKVIGEAVAQVVVEGNINLNAVKVDRVLAELRNVTDHVFPNKVVKQGTIHKQIFFVDPEGVVRHVTEDIPFMVAVDIPGLCPGPFIDVQNHLLDINTDFVLQPKTCEKAAVLMQKVVAHILIKASKWTQMDVITNMEVFPKFF